MTDAEAGPARILVVIGTRPEAIKLAPVVSALAAEAAVEARVALTGQHSELVDQVLEVFSFRPDWDLGIMKEEQDLFDVTAASLMGLRGVLQEYRPDVVIVQGDTASVFSAALAGFFSHTRVAHVEAGLRSGDKARPFPEEVLRQMVSVVADLNFAPTTRAKENLLREGVSPSTIFVTGNTVVDVLQRIAARDDQPEDEVLRDVIESGRRLVLVTAHRRESFGEPLRRAFGALRTLADRHPDIALVYPVHPNPNVQAPAGELLSGHERIHLTSPVSYLDLIWGLRHAALVITDSGGIQEEAPTFGVPVVVLREVTERPEGIDAGVARLTGTDPDAILAASEAALAGRWDGGGSAGNPYGDGRAAQRIADVIASRLTGRARRLVDWAGPSARGSAAVAGADR